MILVWIDHPCLRVGRHRKTHLRACRGTRSRGGSGVVEEGHLVSDSGDVLMWSMKKWWPCKRWRQWSLPVVVHARESNIFLGVVRSWWTSFYVPLIGHWWWGPATQRNRVTPLIMVCRRRTWSSRPSLGDQLQHSPPLSPWTKTKT
jgi:hypothetical protein